MAQTFSTEAWRQVIIPYEIAADYDNPFLDVLIQAAFTGPDGQTITREAYWDGGRSYKFAFAPITEGIWSWKVSAPKETGISGETGTVSCVPYTGDLPIYRHGFLRVHESGRSLCHADGTPFFWLGDTHWEFAYRERWDESNHPEMDSMFRGMADRRVRQGFNIYQTNLRSDAWPDRGGESPYWRKGDAGEYPNVAFYQEELDRRMYYLADLGLVNALGFGWFMSVFSEGIAHWKNTARYILARYGALPIVWTLAGEVAGYAPEPDRTNFINAWREVALWISEHDGYRTLQTAHYDNHRPFSEYYYDEDWYDFTLNQAGHGDFRISAHDFYSYCQAHPAKPFVEGESMYEFCSTLEENGTRLCTADMLRRVAYTAIQCGACGYTYGAQGIWDTVWKKNEISPSPVSVFNRFGITWYEAIDGIGAAQMGYLRRFYEELHFEELRPVLTPGLSPFGDFEEPGEHPSMHDPLTLAAPDADRFVVYYNSNTRGGCRIRNMRDCAYTAQWFNPRTAEWSVCEERLTPEDGCWRAPGRPDGDDWLLVIKSI